MLLFQGSEEIFNVDPLPSKTSDSGSSSSYIAHPAVLPSHRQRSRDAVEREDDEEMIQADIEAVCYVLLPITVKILDDTSQHYYILH